MNETIKSSKQNLNSLQDGPENEGKNQLVLITEIISCANDYHCKMYRYSVTRKKVEFSSYFLQISYQLSRHFSDKKLFENINNENLIAESRLTESQKILNKHGSDIKQFKDPITNLGLLTILNFCSKREFKEIYKDKISSIEGNIEEVEKIQTAKTGVVHQRVTVTSKNPIIQNWAIQKNPYSLYEKTQYSMPVGDIHFTSDPRGEKINQIIFSSFTKAGSEIKDDIQWGLFENPEILENVDLEKPFYVHYPMLSPLTNFKSDLELRGQEMSICEGLVTSRKNLKKTDSYTKFKDIKKFYWKIDENMGMYLKYSGELIIQEDSQAYLMDENVVDFDVSSDCIFVQKNDLNCINFYSNSELSKDNLDRGYNISCNLSALVTGWGKVSYASRVSTSAKVKNILGPGDFELYTDVDGNLTCLSFNSEKENLNCFKKWFKLPCQPENDDYKKTSPLCFRIVLDNNESKVLKMVGLDEPKSKKSVVLLLQDKQSQRKKVRVLPHLKSPINILDIDGEEIDDVIEKNYSESTKKGFNPIFIIRTVKDNYYFYIGKSGKKPRIFEGLELIDTKNKYIKKIANFEEIKKSYNHRVEFQDIQFTFKNIIAKVIVKSEPNEILYYAYSKKNHILKKTEDPSKFSKLIEFKTENKKIAFENQDGFKILDGILLGYLNEQDAIFMQNPESRYIRKSSILWKEFNRDIYPCVLYLVKVDEGQNEQKVCDLDDFTKGKFEDQIVKDSPGIQFKKPVYGKEDSFIKKIKDNIERYLKSTDKSLINLNDDNFIVQNKEKLVSQDKIHSLFIKMTDIEKKKNKGVNLYSEEELESDGIDSQYFVFNDPKNIRKEIFNYGTSQDYQSYSQIKKSENKQRIDCEWLIYPDWQNQTINELEYFRNKYLGDKKEPAVSNFITKTMEQFTNEKKYKENLKLFTDMQLTFEDSSLENVLQYEDFARLRDVYNNEKNSNYKDLPEEKNDD